MMWFMFISAAPLLVAVRADKAPERARPAAVVAPLPPCTPLFSPADKKAAMELCAPQ